MILNWFLLLLTAFIAYVSGSVSTRRVASRYVFKRDLQKLAGATPGFPTSAAFSATWALQSWAWWRS